MKSRFMVFLVLLISFIGFSTYVWGQSGFFSDTTWDIGIGQYINTTTDTDNITLANETVNYYYEFGDYIQTNGFDAGRIVNWTNISWVENISVTDGENILLEIAFSNDIPSSGWSGWTFQADDGFGNFGGVGNITRHIRYKAHLQTGGGNTTTPELESVTIGFEYLEPQVFNQLPDNGAQSTDGMIALNCSAAEDNLPGVIALQNISLYWDVSGSWEANGTSPLTGATNTSSFFRTNLGNGQYTWNCLVYNDNGDFAWGENKTFSVSLGGSDATAPVINDYEIKPMIVLVGNDVTLNISATDNLGLIDSLWASISRPDSVVDNVTLVNNNLVNYTASLIGTYNVVFHANDTGGNEANVTDSFRADELKTFSVDVVGTSGGINSILVAYIQGGAAEEFNITSGSGNFTNLTLIGGIYDFLFSAYSGDLLVKLNGVNISANINRTFGMDKLDTPPSGFGAAYAVDNNYTFNDATVTISYIQSDFQDEDFISVQECGNWSFSGRNCLGNWTDITSSHDKTNNLFEFDVSSFSGFAILQNAFCGDGICGAGETNASCSADCTCSENQTAACGTTDVGQCSYGIQSCVNGEWGPCIGSVEPINETCDQLDNDCDGVIDNAFGGNSIQTSFCQCYNGGSPLGIESCNAIDDNCNGATDEGVAAPCGSDIGACSLGTKTCVNGVFSECTGDIGPVDEICGNFEDDNCNNETDEFCASCTNGIQDGDEEGVDCGGSCLDGCFVFPLDMFIIIAVVIGAVIAAAFVGLKFLKGRKVTWEDVERKYSQ